MEDYPDELRVLFKDNTQEGQNFSQYIQSYNCAFFFASFRAKIRQPPGRGPYCFRMEGQTYHYVSNLHPEENDQ